MNKHFQILPLFIFFVLLSTTACDEAGVATPVQETPTISELATALPTHENPTTEPSENVAEVEESADDDPLATWLTQLQRGEIDTVNTDESLHWVLGYFLYYGPIEGFGIDNLIYNALRAYRRLDRQEVTEETQTQGDKNFMIIADTLDYSPEGALTDQIGQTEAIRAAIFEHIVETQNELSPSEALASNNIVGVIAPPAPNSLGDKFLVYGQDSPDADFRFVGVVMAVDAINSDNVRYLDNPPDGWTSLRWLGDATGPFWQNLPVASSDDPTNEHAARIGVLLINEAVYNDVIMGE